MSWTWNGGSLRAANVADGGQNAPLPFPNPFPPPTRRIRGCCTKTRMERFYLLHPQNLELSPRMSDPNNLELVDQDHGQGKDVFILELPPGPQDPQADRKFRDVEQFQRDDRRPLGETEARDSTGPAGWLPEADWAPLKSLPEGAGGQNRTTPRKGQWRSSESTSTTTWSSPRATSASRYESWTVRDDHVAFRTQSEGIIKSFHFGKWDGQPKAPAAASAAPVDDQPNDCNRCTACTDQHASRAASYRDPPRQRVLHRTTQTHTLTSAQACTRCDNA